jgi:hypothetical protein
VSPISTDCRAGGIERPPSVRTQIEFTFRSLSAVVGVLSPYPPGGRRRGHVRGHADLRPSLNRLHRWRGHAYKCASSIDRFRHSSGEKAKFRFCHADAIPMS